MYCTVENLIFALTLNTLKELVNDENLDLSLINLTLDNIYLQRVLEQINNASTEVNFYLNNSLANNNIPDIIKSITTDIAIFYLYKRRFLSKIPIGVQNNYNKRIEQLKLISSGAININNSPLFNSLLINKSPNDRLFIYDGEIYEC